jgi:hypothetical protein
LHRETLNKTSHREQKKQLEELNARFEVALNNMGRGLSMFDAQARLIVCNKPYRDLRVARRAYAAGHVARGNRALPRQDGDGPRRRRAYREAAQVDRKAHASELARGKSFSHTDASSWSATSLSPAAAGSIFKRTSEKRLAE